MAGCLDGSCHDVLAIFRRQILDRLLSGSQHGHIHLWCGRLSGDAAFVDLLFITYVLLRCQVNPSLREPVRIESHLRGLFTKSKTGGLRIGNLEVWDCRVRCQHSHGSVQLIAIATREDRHELPRNHRRRNSGANGAARRARNDTSAETVPGIGQSRSGKPGVSGGEQSKMRSRSVALIKTVRSFPVIYSPAPLFSSSDLKLSIFFLQ
jgi:hypothetical protein